MRDLEDELRRLHSDTEAELERVSAQIRDLEAERKKYNRVKYRIEELLQDLGDPQLVIVPQAVAE